MFSQEKEKSSVTSLFNHRTSRISEKSYIFAFEYYYNIMDKGQFLLYQTPDGNSQIEVKLQNNTVWLSLDQMAELFQRNKSTISRHIKNVFEDGELDEK